MMEDGRTSDEELLMARSNKRHRKICGEVQFMPKNEE